MKKPKQLSPALTFIAHFYYHTQKQSSVQFEMGMRQCLSLAIEHGLEFDLDDCEALMTGHDGDGVRVAYVRPDERDYALACGRACARSNPSFVRAYEKWRTRKPFCIADRGTVTPTRIYVGREFDWQGTRVRATSFAKDGSHVGACSYRPNRQHEGYGPAKVARRYKITHAALREANATANSSRRRPEPEPEAPGAAGFSPRGPRAAEAIGG